MRAQRLAQDTTIGRAYVRTNHHPAAFNRVARPDSYANRDTKISLEYRALYARLDMLRIVCTEWECEGEDSYAHHTDDVKVHNQIL